MSSNNEHRLEWLHSEAKADKAGLSIGDLIVGYNNQVTASVDDIHRAPSEWPFGRGAEITVVRGREKIKIEVVPEEAD